MANSYHKGRYAEIIALFWLRLKGYKILARRLKTPVGEIDILASKKQVLIAIEVKFRPNLDQALHAISEKQWRRIAKTLLWYQSHTNLPQFDSRTDLRFDAIFIQGWGKLPVHIKNAWQPSQSFS